ncbi:Endoplasmic reticulum mannosyl-oligosaccharide 1,2-alpha-mannosidase [Chionoecetes opilio]|uniref:mannosyl-oligosaccharide 1,2-alpha-mannosidase n=1 Tax=Chionoecetes opilio TaxID=41210 RepID=A0A8J4XZQ3_CHIOP|nr:Endoplasmic reticulum mannosyl-oligosaccharide 1,2-alpha-mannosidase [Chionoecetes opilio]
MVPEEQAMKDEAEHEGHDQIVPPPGLPQKSMREVIGGRIYWGGVGSARQEAVVGAMKHAWKGYKTHAWGHDHLRPISRTRSDGFASASPLLMPWTHFGSWIYGRVR